MKKLKIASAIAVMAVLSSSVCAELTPLSEDSMSNLTGQAGLTIDINSMTIDVGELNYKDQGNLYFTGFRIGGAGIAQEARGDAIEDEMYLDNFSWVLDVAGADDGGELEALWGYDGIPTGGGITKVADSGGTHGETKPEIGDGDLVLQTYIKDQNFAVDYGTIIDRISLGSSDLGAGDDLLGNNVSGTVLASNIITSGVAGPASFIVDNSEGTLNINATWDSTTDVTFDFIATKMQIKMHNSRGKDYLIWSAAGETGTASFFHLQADVGSHEDGLMLNVTDFSGDVDLTGITFGLGAAAVPIGNIYLTDVALNANTVIYGH